MAPLLQNCFAAASFLALSNAADAKIASQATLAADDTCMEGSDCSAELLQVGSEKSERRVETRNGKGKPGGYAKKDGTWVPAEELVAAMYTFGAPATHQQPFRNMASTDGCFHGLRAYTEDITGVDGKMHQVDAASINNFFPHSWVNTAVLHWDADSFYIPCTAGNGPDAENRGHPDWPQRGGQVYENWNLHQEDDYTDRLNNMKVDGKDVTEEFEIKKSRHFVRLAFQAYDKTANYIKSLKALDDDNWRLIGWEEDWNGDDKDPMMLVQDKKSLDCALVFAGTNSFSELGTSTSSWKRDFCGFEGVHFGYANELWTLGKNLIQPKFRAKLEKCNNVITVGHSLGGAVAEIFAACANSGRTDNEDFQQIAWKKGGKPELMDEVECNEEGWASHLTGPPKKR